LHRESAEYISRTLFAPPREWQVKAAHAVTHSAASLFKAIEGIAARLRLALGSGPWPRTLAPKRTLPGQSGQLTLILSAAYQQQCLSRVRRGQIIKDQDGVPRSNKIRERFRSVT
jgi:hypothetical protein